MNIHNTIQSYSLGYNKDAGKVIDPLKKKEMGMEEFLKLIAAQVQNQDMMNPMKDTEFIAQLAQFSALEAMNNVMEMSNKAYSTSLIGKTVKVKGVDDKGKAYEEVGVVKTVGLSGKDTTVTVNGKSYPTSQVISIGEDPALSNPINSENLQGEENSI